MKKILSDDKYGLTDAVLNGRKTMTRRIVSQKVLEKVLDYMREYYEATLDAISTERAIENMVGPEGIFHNAFRPGEVVAVAQAYRDIRDIIGDVHDGKSIKFMAGWNNKLFVRADLMPHHIRITNVRVERLQDISEEDCLREGIYHQPVVLEDHDGLTYYASGYTFKGSKMCYNLPRDAFAALIDKISGKGTWESNPYVFVYEFEKVD